MYCPIQPVVQQVRPAHSKQVDIPAHSTDQRYLTDPARGTTCQANPQYATSEFQPYLSDLARSTTAQASPQYAMSAIQPTVQDKSKQDHDGVYITQPTNEPLLSVCIISDNDSEDDEDISDW